MAINDPVKVKAAFDSHIVKLKANGINPEIIFRLQVGPDDAKTLMKQMFAFYSTGYNDALRELQVI